MWMTGLQYVPDSIRIPSKPPGVWSDHDHPSGSPSSSTVSVHDPSSRPVEMTVGDTSDEPPGSTLVGADGISMEALYAETMESVVSNMSLSVRLWERLPSGSRTSLNA